MELFDDILRIIAGFSDHDVTLVSKAMRDGYFRKNGIWVHLGRKYYKKYTFPEKFYDYPINLSFKDTEMENFIEKDGRVVKLVTEFVSMFGQESKIINWIYKNAVLISNIRVENTKYFPEVTRVKEAEGPATKDAINVLRNRKIGGYTLHLHLPFKYDLLDDVREIDYSIKILSYSNGFSGKIPNCLADKIISVWPQFLTENTAYKNVTELIDSDYDDLSKIYNENNFTNIKIIHTDLPSLRHFVYGTYPILQIVVDRYLTSEHLLVIRKYRLSVNLLVYDDFRDSVFSDLVHFGRDGIVVTYCCHDFEYLYEVLKLHRGVIHIVKGYLSVTDQPSLFLDLLNLNHLGYDILVQIKMYRSGKFVDIVDDSINIYKTTGIFLNFSNIHRGSMGNIEEYLSIRDRVLSGYPEVLL